MSLLPYFLDNTSRIFDQHFGHGLNLEDLMSSMSVSPISPFLSPYYFRPWRSLARTASNLDSGSRISVSNNKFQVCLDVQQFSPGEITVKTVGRYIVVEGKHEEKQDEHGLISRHFIRKYVLPDGYHPEDVESSLSSDGILSISACRKSSQLEEGEKMVPINSTSQSAIKEANKDAE